MNNNQFDALMQITNLSNREVARLLDIHPSFITRIRKGQRKPPKGELFLNTVSNLFAEHITTEYQVVAVEQLLMLHEPLPKNNSEVASILKDWLTKDEANVRPNMTGTIISHITEDRDHLMSLPTGIPAELSSRITSITPEYAHFYYGNAGKREAVLNFLLYLNRTNEPKELTLFSDEDMLWLTEDSHYLKTWGILIMNLLHNGSTIRIIHNISRDNTELEHAISFWMPLYMTGRIEPYYLPSSTDNTKCRSLFVAEGIAAVSSCSVAGISGNMPVLLTFDEKTVAGFSDEFTALFAPARLLMKIFKNEEYHALHASLSYFLKKASTFTYAGSVPSLYTMPIQVVRACSEDPANQDYRLLCKTAREGLRNRLKRGYDVTDIIHLPSLQKLKNELPVIPLTDLFCGEPQVYQISEFKEHLQAILTLAEQEEHYHLILSRRFPDTAAAFFDGKTVFVGNATPPSTVFAISEPGMCQAFSSYLKDIQTRARDKAETIEMLKKYIEKI